MQREELLEGELLEVSVLQWEFLIVQLHPSVANTGYRADPNKPAWKPINELGAEGWELVSVWYMSRAAGSPTYAAFKRPLEAQGSKLSGSKK